MKSGGMDVPEAKWFNALEAENTKLKKTLAEHLLDIPTLKETLRREAGKRHWFERTCRPF